MKQPAELAPAKAGCLIRLRSSTEALKRAEQTIADFVLADPTSVIQMSISELAQDLVAPSEFIHEKITFHDRTADLTDKIFQANLNAVESTRRSLDPDRVDVAAASLTGARKIEIYGAVYSYFTALDAKHKFLRLGLIADAYGDGHLQAMGAAALSKKDVAIGISHSGSSRDVVEALTIARQAGASVIAITNFSPSPITRAADVVLLTAAPETPLGVEVLTSRIAQLCVIDVLAATVAIRLGESCLQYIRKASDAIKKKRY